MFIPLVERKPQNYSEEPMNRKEKKEMKQRAKNMLCSLALCWFMLGCFPQENHYCKL